jgi:hypothetical protein
MEMVASEAISRARFDERGVVVKTTKYGMEEARENVTEAGKVTWIDRQTRKKIWGVGRIPTAQRNAIIRSDLRGISSHEVWFDDWASDEWKSGSGCSTMGISKL